MDSGDDYTELVVKAQGGDEESMDRLATLAQESLRRYVFRITLDEALTQDIVQEVMLEMVKVLGKLKRADRFSAWLHGIAFNLIRRHYGDKWRGKVVSGGEAAYPSPGADGQEGLANLVNAELKQIIFAAMNHLEPRHRAVLTMRCYGDMSYREIAETMGTSEFGTRALFFRAKKALARQLSRRGLGRGSLLTALVLFGKMTAVSEAAAAQVSVTAATLKAGVAAGAAGVMAGQGAAVALTAATVITAGAVVAVLQGDKAGAVAGTEVRQTLPVTAAGETIEADVHEDWYYFPEGVHGPVMMRRVLVDHAGHPRHCQWLQNHAGNYTYDPRSNTITLTNHRIWTSDYSVRRLPTDSPELSDFISAVQGDSAAMEYIGSRGRDLLVIARSGHGDESSGSWTARHCNALEEDYFKCDWPRGATLIDHRDAVHVRGWTHFTVAGRLGDETVSGSGCIPFVYGAGRMHPAWLSLRVGDGEIAGDSGGLWVRDGRGKVVTSRSDAKGGGIFAGLSRPWAGLHTLDTIRRDAAMRRMPFETRVDGRKATVVLDCGDLKMNYTIDMMDDLVEEIVFTRRDGTEAGYLRFRYDQEGEGTSGPAAPRSAPGGAAEESEGILWLLKLASGEFGLGV